MRVLCAHAYSRGRPRASVGAQMRAWVRVYVCACVRVCMRVCMRAFVAACMCAWLRVWPPACVSVCLSACMHGRLGSWVPVCLHACMFSHVPVFDCSLPGILQTSIAISFSRASAWQDHLRSIPVQLVILASPSPRSETCQRVRPACLLLHCTRWDVVPGPCLRQEGCSIG